LGMLEAGMSTIHTVRCGSRAASPATIVAGWIELTPTALLAIDAPLGWPKQLGLSLVAHEAGGALTPTADQLFHRETDDAIERELKKRPLEVGANLIARTAHAALSFLEELRRLTGLAVPLTWDREERAGVSAIEVYPAATLRAHGIEAGEYKKASQIAGRQGILERLGAHVALPGDMRLLEASADALDAVVCVVAGADFLEGRAVGPTNASAARKEGWIWAPRPAEP